MDKSLFFCTIEVNKKNIRRESRRGVEHIVINSLTLPPNIVMNGILFAVSEVTDEVIDMFNRTPATVEHPEIEGQFVSANDPEIDLEGFRIGAFNENAHRVSDGRISLDKVINVQKALQHEKGKRLLDRITEIETNKDAKPLHTSIGVFTSVETFDKEQKTASGQVFKRKAIDIIPDHDAILIDSVGAATPADGVGIGVNKQGVKVEHFVATKQTETIATNEGDLMRKLLVEKLLAMKVEVDEKLTDDQVFQLYQKSVTDQNKTENDAATAKAVELAVNKSNDENNDDAGAGFEKALEKFSGDLLAKVDTRFETIEKTLTANQDADIAKKSKVIIGCAKFAALDEAILKTIHSTDIEKFDKMYAESIPAYQLGSTEILANAENDEFADYDMNAIGGEK